jgi:hypothetical protein
MIVMNEKFREFPKVDEKIYAPEGSAWITTPTYAESSHEYWKRVHEKC